MFASIGIDSRSRSDGARARVRDDPRRRRDVQQLQRLEHAAEARALCDWRTSWAPPRVRPGLRAGSRRASSVAACQRSTRNGVGRRLQRQRKLAPRRERGRARQHLANLVESSGPSENVGAGWRRGRPHPLTPPPCAGEGNRGAASDLTPQPAARRNTASPTSSPTREGSRGLEVPLHSVKGLGVGVSAGLGVRPGLDTCVGSGAMNRAPTAGSSAGARFIAPGTIRRVDPPRVHRAHLCCADIRCVRIQCADTA